MMVPRSFKCASSPPKEVLDDQHFGRRHVKPIPMPRTPKQKSALRPASPVHASTQPVHIVSKPVAVPKVERSHSATSQTMPTRSRKSPTETRGASMRSHDPNALPPAVAALLAVTAIPPRRSSRRPRKMSDNRQISIDELVNEWKSEDTVKGSYGSSVALSLLLEDVDDVDDQSSTRVGSPADESRLHGRSASAESVPSLSSDERSVLSFGSPSTPESVRSNRSSSNLKRERARSLVTAEDSSTDHPLVPLPLDDEEDDLIFSAPSSKSSTPKPKSSFTSNLTTSLKALKRTAITSMSSIGLGNYPSQGTRSPSAPFSDEMLWSHPFLFPHFSSEIRPDIQGTPTLAQRRYLNPAPLTFEEQEAPFQQLLHAPYLAERDGHSGSTGHEMQSYNRGKRKSNHNNQEKRTTPNLQSEAGRTALAAAGVRQREPRENSDFLRVVVLEMNMRREGKLETGRARIWLPPRQVTVPCAERMNDGIPKRWEGITAAY